MSTTTLDSLLEKLARRDVHVAIHGNDLKVEGPGSAIDDQLIAELRSHKHALVGRLVSDAPSAATRGAQDKDDRPRPGLLARILGVPVDGEDDE